MMTIRKEPPPVPTGPVRPSHAGTGPPGPGSVSNTSVSSGARKPTPQDVKYHYTKMINHEFRNLQLDPTLKSKSLFDLIDYCELLYEKSSEAINDASTVSSSSGVTHYIKGYLIFNYFINSFIMLHFKGFDAFIEANEQDFIIYLNVFAFYNTDDYFTSSHSIPLKTLRQYVLGYLVEKNLLSFNVEELYEWLNQYIAYLKEKDLTYLDNDDNRSYRSHRSLNDSHSIATRTSNEIAKHNGYDELTKAHKNQNLNIAGRDDDVLDFHNRYPSINDNYISETDSENYYVLPNSSKGSLDNHRMVPPSASPPPPPLPENSPPKVPRIIHPSSSQKASKSTPYPVERNPASSMPYPVDRNGHATSTIRSVDDTRTPDDLYFGNGYKDHYRQNTPLRNAMSSLSIDSNGSGETRSPYVSRTESYPAPRNDFQPPGRAETYNGTSNNNEYFGNYFNRPPKQLPIYKGPAVPLPPVNNLNGPPPHNYSAPPSQNYNGPSSQNYNGPPSHNYGPPMHNMNGDSQNGYGHSQPQGYNNALYSPYNGHGPSHTSIIPHHVQVQQNQIKTSKINYMKDYSICGLKNFGSSCYINSTIQLLFGVFQLKELFTHSEYHKYIKDPKFVKLIKQQKDSSSKNANSESLLSESISGLLRTFKQHGSSSISPTKFIRISSSLKPDFNIPYEQQDAQEFLLFVLERLHEELSNKMIVDNHFDETEFDRYIRKWEININMNDKAEYIKWYQSLLKNEGVSPINDLFQGHLQNKLVCNTCGFESINYSSFTILSLPIPNYNQNGVIDLSDCLRYYTQDEVLSGDNAWNCPKCNHHTGVDGAETGHALDNHPVFTPKRSGIFKLGRRSKSPTPKSKTPKPTNSGGPPAAVSISTKKLNFIKLPRVLFIHLSRFSMFNLTDKLDVVIQYPLILKFNDNHNHEIGYKLSGLINHYGNLKSGHYTALVNKSTVHERQTFNFDNLKHPYWCLFDDDTIKVNLSHGNVNQPNYQQLSSRDVYVLCYERI